MFFFGIANAGVKIDGFGGTGPGPLKETEELVTDSNNRYKITIELANIAKRYEYEFKNVPKSNLATREKPIIVGLKLMVKKTSIE